RRVAGAAMRTRSLSPSGEASGSRYSAVRARRVPISSTRGPYRASTRSSARHLRGAPRDEVLLHTERRLRRRGAEAEDEGGHGGDDTLAELHGLLDVCGKMLGR